MLQNIRDNSQGWIAKTIIGVIVALMALTGFDAIFQATTHRNDAAKVNGEEISQNELSLAVAPASGSGRVWRCSGGFCNCNCLNWGRKPISI